MLGNGKNSRVVKRVVLRSKNIVRMQGCKQIDGGWEFISVVKQ